MSADTRQPESTSAPLAVTSDTSAAERRVEQAKASLTRRLSALERRARFMAKQSAWLAGAVLLGVAGAAVMVGMLGRSVTRRRAKHEIEGRPRGLGGALMLAALGMINSRIRRSPPRLGRVYEPRL